MVNKFIYNSETKSFSLDGVATGINITGGLLNMGSTLQQMNQMAKADKYGVVGINSKGSVFNKTTRANSGLDAINKIKKTNNGATKLKAFKIPEQDDEYAAYAQSLSR